MAPAQSPLDPAIAAGSGTTEAREPMGAQGAQRENRTEVKLLSLKHRRYPPLSANRSFFPNPVAPAHCHHNGDNGPECDAEVEPECAGHKNGPVGSGPRRGEWANLAAA